MRRRIGMRQLSGIVCVLLVAALAAGGCSKPKRVLTAQQRNEVDKNILQGLPEDPGLRRLDARFGDGITLLGVTLSTDHPKPGDTVTVTWWWKCEQKVEGDWKIFVHLDSAKRSTFDHYAVNGLLPVAAWEPGTVIQDVQTLEIPASYPAGPARLWVGFFDAAAWHDRQENRRLPIKDPGTARKDGSDRVLAATLRVGKDEPKAVAVRRAPGPVAIDGELGDPGWAQALLDLGRLTLERTGAPLPAGQEVQAGLLWDDTNLYLAFEVKDADVRSPYAERDSTLWSDGKKGNMDVVELFLTPAAEAGAPYIEVQVSPAGVVFDAAFTGHRVPDWKKAAAALDMPVVAAAKVQGTLNADGKDQGWRAEFAIPFAAIPGAGKAPAAGTAWRINLFRLSNGPEKPAAWSPAGSDYHDLSLGGTITFQAP